MTRKRKKYSEQFKFKVALEAVNELRTINEIASSYDVHPTQVKTWKKQLLAEGPTVFRQNTAQLLREQEDREAERYEQIGRLKMELEWLKKSCPIRSVIQSDERFQRPKYCDNGPSLKKTS